MEKGELFQPHRDGGFYGDLYATPDYAFTSMGPQEISGAITIETPPLGLAEPSESDGSPISEKEKAMLWYKHQPKPGSSGTQIPLTAETDDKSWQDFANCNGVDPDLFFPERGASTRESKEVCRGCIVREECLEYALANGEKFGIWGGASERARRRMRKARAVAARTGNVALAD